MSSRRTARSLADADQHDPRTRRRSGRRILPSVVAVAVLAGGVAGYATMQGDAAGAGSSVLSQPALTRVDGQAVTPGKALVVFGQDSQTTPAPALSYVRVDVLVDGWTARTLQDLHLRWAPAGSSSFKPVSLEPATDADVAELLRSTPSAVTDALARQYTGDSTLTCDANGCKTKDHAIDLDVLHNPASVPGLGRSYQGWGVGALLYRASFTLPPDATAVVLRADGFRDESLPAVPTALAGEQPSAANGYLRNRYVLGAGLGSFFALDPQWLSGEREPHKWTANPVVGVDADVAAATRATPPQITAINGLAASWEPAGYLTSSHLTYMTSPVTGCGVGVLCVPTKTDTTVISRTQDAAVACLPGKLDTPNVAVLDDIRIRTHLPAPVHQFGVYGGTPVTKFKDRTGFGVNGGGQPPLVDGDLELRWRVAGMVDTPDAKLRTLAGRTDTPDTGGMDDSVGLGDVMANVRFDGARWGACS